MINYTWLKLGDGAVSTAPDWLLQRLAEAGGGAASELAACGRWIFLELTCLELLQVWKSET